MIREPEVSVLLPVRDGAPFLAEALASLLAQRMGAFEVVVEDDGSTDRSPEIARGFAARDPRVRVAGGPARGLVAALNAAARRARAPLLVRMDADDVATCDRLGRLALAAAAHPDVAFFASRVRFFPREALSEGMLRYEAWVNGLLDHEAIVRERFVECPMPHPAWAIRRAAFESLGGYREGDFPEDYDLFLRAAAAGLRFLKVPDVLLSWREGPWRTSRTHPRYRLARFFALKVEHLRPRLEREGRPVKVLGEGRWARRWVRALCEAGVEASPLDPSADADAGLLGLRSRRPDRAARGDRPARTPRPFVLVAEARAGGREALRERLDGAGEVEERDFLCVQ